MTTNDMINALKMVTLALEEVERNNGVLPSELDAEVPEYKPPATFLELAKQYSGDRISADALLAAVDAVSPLLDHLKIQWK